MKMHTDTLAVVAKKASEGDGQAYDRLAPFAIRRVLELLDERELATFLSVDLRTIHRWRAEGRGPAFIKAGNTVLFRLADLRDWLEGRVEQTAEAEYRDAAPVGATKRRLR